MERKEKRRKVVVSALGLAGLLVLSLFAIAGNLQPSAPPAPTMKTLDEVEPRIPIQSLSGDANAVHVIDQPGSYYFTGDVNVSATDMNGILVEVDDVTIDLMGYTLKGSGLGTGSGIYIMDGRSNVEIRSGTVRDFGRHGIHEGGYGKGHRVIGVRAVSNGINGVFLSGSGQLVKDCTALENDGYGIYAHAGSTVTGNTADNNGYIGISAGLGSTVIGNTAYDNNGSGISTGDCCTVTGNTARSNGQNGIYVYGGSTVTGNTAYENGGHGIDAGTGCTIIGNTARLNTGNGIDFDGLGTIADNTADRNSGYGISVTSGAVVARNSCAENTLDGIKAGDGNRIVGNDCVGNGNGGDGAGIHVQSQRNVIMDNTVLQNDRGIDVDAANNLIVKNSASTNGTEYSIVGGNKVGTTSTDPTTAGPWDNFDF